MHPGNWLLLSGFFWISGYLQLKFLEPEPNSRLMYVPRWLYILCGAPKHRNVPSTVMHARSVYLQLMAIFMALYGLLLDQNLIEDPLLSGLLGLGVSMLVSGGVVKYLYKKWEYSWQDQFMDDE